VSPVTVATPAATSPTEATQAAEASTTTSRTSSSRQRSSPPKPAAKAAAEAAAPAGEASAAPAAPSLPTPQAPAVAILPAAPAAPKRDETTTPAESASPVPAEPAPPVVAERPVLPNTYSAHVAAGVLPGPTGAEDRATYVAADHITGLNDVEVIATGNADLRKLNKRLTADKITYWEADAEVEATGNVRLMQDQDLMEGPYLRMKTEHETGYFDKPTYRIKREPKLASAQPGLFAEAVYPGEKPLVPMRPGSTGSGSAERIDFLGQDRLQFSDATYSTCEPAAGNDPDWYARASSFDLDYNDEEGIGRNTAVFFKGVPILYSPWLSFSLNHRRRSGLLAPSFGSTTLGGQHYAQPIYWNIAPNRDATITPRIMSKRGMLVAGEFRYLDPMYSGTVNGQYLPNDKLTGTSRNSLSLTHTQNLGYGFAGNLAYNSVSDYRFLSDLSNSVIGGTQTNLLKQGILTYGASWWSASLMAQAYQTLQDPALDPLKLNEPYRRLPQLTLTANRSDLPLGGVFAFNSEHVQFRHPTRTEASRFTIYPQVSLPVVTTATYITPKIGYHATSYDLSRQGAGVPAKQSRGVPIFSIDSGVTFERNTDWFGRNFTQTLEPRLHYLYVPVRDQNAIPVFDTGLTDFNFATIFAENRYGGGDRIGDANQLTGMVTSRLLDPDTGAELIRGAFGQRVYFTTQKVGLPATPTTPAEVLRTNRQTDLLAALSGRVAPNTYADAGVQYNPNFSRTERLTLSARYQPDLGRVLNASYRYSRDILGQIDLSAQWPLWGRWNAVGRVNYSTKEKRLIENLAGLEYDAGCWAVRGVVQQFATISGTANRSIMFQLELKGLSTIGVGDSVTGLLKRNIPGYGIISPAATSGTIAAN
jgi:LPS-assembly protein